MQCVALFLILFRILSPGRWATRPISSAYAFLLLNTENAIETSGSIARKLCRATALWSSRYVFVGRCHFR